MLIERLDGARPMTADIALSKAYSAAVMQRPTEMLENWRNSDPVFFTQVGRMGHRPIVATKGGVTIKRDGAILGGLGISAAARRRTSRSAWTRSRPPVSSSTSRSGRARASPDERSSTAAAMADDYKYHIDHHGSVVRPGELLAARASGDAAALAAAETEAAVAVSHALRRLALSAVGDGQFRREHFESVVYDPVDRPVFVQLPSPGYLAAVGSALAQSADLDAVRARGVALAAVLRGEIEALAAEGVAYVALANPLYPPLLTVPGRERLTAADLDADAVLAALLEADRAVLKGLTAPVPSGSGSI